jgi:hypothetical protein
MYEESHDIGYRLFDEYIIKKHKILKLSKIMAQNES